MRGIDRGGAGGELFPHFLLYPDPWPKRRQNKRRFVSEAMIAGACARVARPGGELRFATDIDDYAGWTLRRFLASPDFVWNARARRRLAKALARLVRDPL